MATWNGSVVGGESFAKGIIGADQTGLDFRVLDLHRNNLSALDWSRNRGRVVGVKRECPVGPAQIGRAHAGDSLAFGGDRREICGDAKNRIGDVVVVEHRPKRDAFAELFGRAAADRDNPIAHSNGVLRCFHSRSREIKLKGFRITMDEIENPVPSGVHASDQVRPRDRTLRRDAGAEFSEGALFSQAGEVWHLPFLHEFSEELRVHAVDAKDNQFLTAARVGASALAGRQQEGADTQHQDNRQPDSFFQTVAPFTTSACDKIAPASRNRAGMSPDDNCAECPRL